MIERDGSPRTWFERALVYAAQIHAGQARKGGRAVPYVAHLLGVTALVLEDGGDETQGIGALLHDSVEDQGGYERLADIRERFGPDVATIVDGCSDSYGEPKAPWRDRKEAYISRLASEPIATLRVSLADKLYNARTILMDCRVHGAGYLDSFNGGVEGTLWYYRSLVKAFSSVSGFESPMLDELDRVTSELERLVP